MKQFILNRLGESSTWRGIFLIASAFGLYSFTEDQEHAIESLAIALFGAWHFTPDNFK